MRFFDSALPFDCAQGKQAPLRMTDEGEFRMAGKQKLVPRGSGKEPFDCAQDKQGLALPVPVQGSRRRPRMAADGDFG